MHLKGDKHEEEPPAYTPTPTEEPRDPLLGHPSSQEASYSEVYSVPVPQPPAQYGTIQEPLPPAHGSKTAVVVFSGRTLNFHGRTAPRKINASAVFGGVTVDLRDAALQPGETVVNVFALFGGVDIIALPNVRVEVDGMAVFGGFDDERKYDTNAYQPDRWVRVKGFAMFGGCSVRAEPQAHQH